MKSKDRIRRQNNIHFRKVKEIQQSVRINGKNKAVDFIVRRTKWRKI